MLTYIFALIILFIMLVAHIFGINGLYYHYPFYDIFMHVLGGAGIGLLLIAFIRSNFSNFANILFLRRKVVLGVLVVGLMWELFEMYFDIAGAPLWTTAYYIDTAKDLINDVIGASIVAWLIFRKKK
ncbi:MAG: hypothetical protein WCG02_03470 [Candidatus Taylorbacteria bacterium]